MPAKCTDFPQDTGAAVSGRGLRKGRRRRGSERQGGEAVSDTSPVLRFQDFSIVKSCHFVKKQIKKQTENLTSDT